MVPAKDYNKTTMIKIYFDVPWKNETNESFLEIISRQTPDHSGEWNQITAISNPKEADYHVCFDQPSSLINPSKTILLCAEPPCHYSPQDWNAIEAKYKFFIRNYYKPQRWWINASYDELCSLDNIKKDYDVSWITSDKGRRSNRLYRYFRKKLIDIGFRKWERKNIPLLDRGPHDGHIMRMDFLERLFDEQPGLVDLYGRGDFDLADYKGEIDDKWEGLSKYRYSLAVENYKGPNYFTEKVIDPLLAWCMPIYWGCTNLEQFLPQNSFIRVDIEDDKAPERIREIVNSDFREKNIEAIAKAREKILNYLQIWPTVGRIISNIGGNTSEKLDNEYQIA